MSASMAYIHPNKDRPNLTVQCDSLVTKILIEGGKKAVGVQTRIAGVEKQINASKEVILSSGAINSPHLLMISGVGDCQELESFGIKPIFHSPLVGKNLQDHLEVYVQYECKNPISIKDVRIY
jgi:choline dehydrogenase